MTEKELIKKIKSYENQHSEVMIETVKRMNKTSLSYCRNQNNVKNDGC